MRILQSIPFEQYKRGSGLGGSDVACVIEKHPYKSLNRVWAEKTGLIGPEDLSAKDAVWFGKQFEEPIIQRWCDNHGIDRQLIVKPGTFQDPVYPWAFGSPDGFHVNGDFGIEVKDVGYRQLSRWGQEHTDQIPVEYWCQVAWYARLLEIDKWFIIGLFGTELRTFEFTRRLDVERELLTRCEHFWHKHVLAKVPPKPKGDKTSENVLKAMFPTIFPNIRVATPGERKLIDEYEAAALAASESEKTKQRLKQELCQAIGGDLGITDGVRKVLWKHTKSGRSFDFKDGK